MKIELTTRSAKDASPVRTGAKLPARFRLLGVVIALAAVLSWPAVQAAAPRLRVSDNQRFLVKEDGTPFFYLGDTAWELFHRLNREEAARYLEHRARNGFTVIQAVAIAELDGHKDPNAYGHLPLVDLDPTRPDVKEGPNNDYWDHVDYIVNQALLVTFGRDREFQTWLGHFHPEDATRIQELVKEQPRGGARRALETTESPARE